MLKTVLAAGVLAITLLLSHVPVARAEPAGAGLRVEIAPEVTLAVRDLGDDRSKPPVLMLTGGPGFAGAQLLSTAEALSKTRRVILPDQRGTGESGVPIESLEPGLFSFEQAVADLEALRHAMGVEQWAITGHSWGGLLAMLYAAEHPERVASLALISPAGVESGFWRTYQQNIVAALGDAQRQQMGGVAPPADESVEAVSAYITEVNRIMSSAFVVNPDAIAAVEAEMIPGNFTPAVSLIMQADLQNYDLRGRFDALDVPVVVIQGDGDPIGRATADDIVAAIPNAELRVIESCGHFPMFERPAELNRLLAGFFGT